MLICSVLSEPVLLVRFPAIPLLNDHIVTSEFVHQQSIAIEVGLGVLESKCDGLLYLLAKTILVDVMYVDRQYGGWVE